MFKDFFLVDNNKILKAQYFQKYKVKTKTEWFIYGKDPNNKIKTTQEFFDKRGRTIQTTYFHNNFKITQSYYKYDLRGNKIQEAIFHFRKDTVSGHTIFNYEYDNKNRLIKNSGETNDEGPLEGNIYEYNDSLNMIMSFRVDREDCISKPRINYYNKNGWMVKSTSDNLLRRYYYFPDSVQELLFESDKFKGKTIIKYNTKGEVIEEISLDSANAAVQKIIHEFDSYGNEIEDIYYNQKGEISSRWLLEFDENKNKILEDYYESNNKFNSRKIYKYNNSLLIELQYSETLKFNGDKNIYTYEFYK